MLFLSLSLIFYSLSLSRSKSSRKRTPTTDVYLGYHTNPKHCFFFSCAKKICLSRFFFRVSRHLSHFKRTHAKKRRRTMNTSGGGTTREHQHQHQQQTRGGNQEAVVVGSGDTVVPTTQFSSKQSKTSTVTITGGLIVSHRLRVRFLSFDLSLSLSFFNLSPFS